MVSTQKYATAPEVFGAFNQQNQTSDLTQMNRIIDTVSRWIDGYTNRQDYGFVALETATANIYAGTGKNFLFIADCIEVTSVKMKTSISQTTYDYTFKVSEWYAYRGSYRNPQYNKKPYTGILLAYNAKYPRFTDGAPANISRKWNRLHPDSPNQNSVALPTVEVTAKWGYAATVPPIIKEVCIMESIRVYKAEEAGMGDVALNPTLGDMQFVRALHPTAKSMLDSSNLKMGKVPGLRR